MNLTSLKPKRYFFLAIFLFLLRGVLFAQSIAKPYQIVISEFMAAPLSSQSRREELARMLSGAKVTDSARAQAEELLAGRG